MQYDLAEQARNIYGTRMALCIYHLTDDPEKIPRLVKEIVAGYRTGISCLCALDRIQPEVAFFY